MDIDKLKTLLADDRFKSATTPDEIFAIGAVEAEPIPVPVEKTQISFWEANGLANVSPADIKLALEPPKQYRSPDGAPGSWHVQPEGSEFRLYWDFKPQPDAPLFKTVAEAEAWQAQWYIDNPPVEVVA